MTGGLVHCHSGLELSWDPVFQLTLNASGLIFRESGSAAATAAGLDTVFFDI